MGRQQRLDAARAFDASRFVPFVADGAVLGYVRRDHAERLRRYPDVFALTGNAVGFCAPLQGHAERSGAMARVARALSGLGLLSAWRGETYDIAAAEDAPALFALERCAVRFFGFTAHAVHVNGLTSASGRRRMWIAQRSADKAIDPGMLDTLVGGGCASGLSREQTLVKEAWEEAGIAAGLAAQARATARLRVLREVPEGLHAEIIHVYDLWLPQDFVPSNQDGEVAAFRCPELEDVACELAGDAPYTVDAAMVALDCLERCGVPVP